jgi:NAD(P)-dependent dehydrogenase (short-subunit alcohol dehydrogenase family)
MAVVLAPLRVNVLSPGVVETPGQDFLSEADRNVFLAEQAESLPSRTWEHLMNDIADAALTLIGNRCIAGTVLHVDAGG